MKWEKWADALYVLPLISNPFRTRNYTVSAFLNSSNKKISQQYKFILYCPLKQNLHLNNFFSTVIVFWYKTRDNLNHLEILGNLQ